MKILLIFIVCATLAFAQQTKKTETTTTNVPEFSSTVGEIEEFLTTENSTICEDNSTNCATTTEYPNVTTIKAKNETVPKDNLPVSSSKKQDYCTCDLMRDFCDVNCCCDTDCSSEDKEVFQYCQSEPRYYDTRYCDYTKYMYINNKLVQWHINENGLFCIAKSNLPPSYVVQRKHPLKTFAESQLEKLNKFSWRKGYTDVIDTFTTSKKLVFGNPMWLVNKRGIHKFGFLNSFVTNRCLIKEDILYLKNSHTRCSQSDLDEENPYINLKYYFENVYLISNPMLVNTTTWKQKVFETCPKNVCLPIVPQICDKSFNNCENIVNNSRITVQCNFTITTKTKTCYNLVKQLQYIILHNGTKGVYNISVLAILDSITYELGDDPPEFNQEFSVRFFWRNKSKENVEYSGNPGYLIGKPLLTSTLFSVKNGSDTRLEIKRNITSFFTIPKNIQGDCVFNDFLNIEFGYNILTKCKFRTIIFNNKKNVNATDICRAIQKAILLIWNINNNTMVGSFGNADVKNLNDWLKILYKTKPEILLNNTFGLYSSKTNYIFCSNLVSDLEIDIFHSKIDIDTLLNQEKLLGVSLSFGGFTNRSLQYIKDTSSVYFETEIKTSVTFYDLTTKKVKKAVDPPSLDIKLPYDFFYPFVRIDNGCGGNNINILSLILLLFVMLFN